MLFAIDPGLQGTGWAKFVGGHLRECGVIELPGFAAELPWWRRSLLIVSTYLCHVEGPALHYCEMPEYFGGAINERGWRTGDLQRTVYLVGSFAGALGASFTPVRVRDWKGQLPKVVVTRRIRKILGDEICTKLHIESHAWDAVGLGLWALGKFQ